MPPHIYIYVCVWQQPAKVEAHAMVHPGSSVLPEADSPAPYRSAVRSVKVCWYDTMGLSLLDQSAV